MIVILEKKNRDSRKVILQKKTENSIKGVISAIIFPYLTFRFTLSHFKTNQDMNSVHLKHPKPGPAQQLLKAKDDFLHCFLLF